MTSIPQLAAALQTVLTDVADQAGRDTNFIVREVKLRGSTFTQTLTFGWLSDGDATVEGLAQTAAALGVQISPQGLDQRFTEQAAACLEQVLAAAIEQLVSAEPVAVPLLNRFTAVQIQDSSTITLPKALADVWFGCTQGTAALKTHLGLDLRTGRLDGPVISDGRTHDSTVTLPTALPPGSLRLIDLAYFNLDTFASLSAEQRYWLSRFKTGTSVYDADGVRHELPEWLSTQSGAVVDMWVGLGARGQLRCRLLAVRVPQEVVDQRRRRLYAAARKRGGHPSAASLALAEWTLLITNVPRSLLSVREALILARSRWQIEIVFTQMTKTHMLAGGTGGNDIADLDRLIGHYHPVDQQFDQLPTLLKRSVRQPTLDSLAEVGYASRQRGDLHLSIDLDRQLLKLLRERLLFPFQIIPAALILNQRQNTRQIRLGQAVHLVLNPDLGFTQVLFPCLQFLRQPVAALCSGECLGNTRRVCQHRAQVVPDQLIQLFGWNEARLAFAIAARNHRMPFRPTYIVAIAARLGACVTSGLADPTTDQCPQQVGVDGVVARRKLLIVRQFGLHLLKLFLCNDGGDGCYRNPLLARQQHPRRGRLTNRVGRRPPYLWRPSAHPARVDLTRVALSGKNTAQRGQVPAPRAARGGHVLGAQLLGQTDQAHAIFQIARDQLLHRGGFGWVEMHPGRVARAVGIDTVAVRRARPGQQDARAQFHLPAAAHTFGNHAAFVFRHGTTDLQQQLVMRVRTHGAIQELDLAAVARQFVQQEHLMDVVARQAVGRGQDEPVQSGCSGQRPQAIQARAIQARPAVAIITEDVVG